VNDQTGRFVDDGEVFVFEDQREGDSGRLDGPGRLVLRDVNGDPLSSSQGARGAGRLSSNRDELVGHQPRRLGSGQPHLVSEEPVQPLGLRAQDRKLYFVMAGTAG
jgi:hypothetical protein